MSHGQHLPMLRGKRERSVLASGLQLEHHLQQDCSKEEAAHQAFAAVDELMQTKLGDEAKLFASGTSSGTVACVALLRAEELVLLNLGDCRAVLCETGR